MWRRFLARLKPVDRVLFYERCEGCGYSVGHGDECPLSPGFVPAWEWCHCERVATFGAHQKSKYLWLCKYGYLEKEVNYALHDLQREDGQPGWRTSAITRLNRLFCTDSVNCQRCNEVNRPRDIYHE